MNDEMLCLLLCRFQLQVCLLVSGVSTVLSVVAVIIYSVDMDRNPEAACGKVVHGSCSEMYYAMVGASFISRHYVVVQSPTDKDYKEKVLSILKKHDTYSIHTVYCISSFLCL